jgi:23S rRNA (guanosine2251-2'-O)-methyltransferase
MSEYIEGKRPVIEALRTHVPIEAVLLADNVKRDTLISDILRKAKAQKVPVRTVRRADLDRISARGSHQGVAAQAKPFPYAGMGDVLAHAEAQAARTDGRALIVALDHITDAGNLGAIVRSAEVVGAAGVVIPNKRSAQVTAATYKSSAGAVANMPIAQVANLKQALERCKEAGFWVAGASEKADQSIWDANLKGKIVLVMGNEGEGLARLTQETCDFLVGLPQVGKTASLNVAQSATACMYEWLRQNERA